MECIWLPCQALHYIPEKKRLIGEYWEKLIDVDKKSYWILYKFKRRNLTFQFCTNHNEQRNKGLGSFGILFILPIVPDINDTTNMSKINETTETKNSHWKTKILREIQLKVGWGSVEWYRLKKFYKIPIKHFFFLFRRIRSVHFLWKDLKRVVFVEWIEWKGVYFPSDLAFFLYG